MRRTRQPQGAARIALDSPLASGLSFLFDGKTPVNACSNALLVPVNTPTQEVYSGGIKTKFVRASSQYLNCGTGPDVDFSGKSITVAVRYSLATAPGVGEGYILFARDSNTGGRQFTVDITKTALASTSGVRIYAAGGGTVGTNMVVEQRLPVTGDDRFVVCVYSPSGNRADIWVDGLNVAGVGASTAIPTATTNASIGRRSYSGFEDYLNGSVAYVAAWNRALSSGEILYLTSNPWQLFAPTRRIWVQLGAASGGVTTTDADIAGTQTTDVGAVTVEATTGAAIAGTQATDVGAVTVEATTGSAIAGTQASDVAAANVTASTGTGTDADIAGTQASDVGAVAVSATLGLSIAGTQASDLGYIVVEATLPASMAGTQSSDGAAITVAGVGIWTDVGVSSVTWSDVGGATSIWSDL